MQEGPSLKVNPNQAQQQGGLRTIPGSVVTQSFVGFGAEGNALHQSQAQQGFFSQHQQAQARLPSHHIATRNTAQQSGRTQLIGHLPTSTGCLAHTRPPSETLSQLGRGPHAVCEHHISGPPSLALTSSGKALQTRMQQMPQEYMHPRPLAVAANGLSDSLQRDRIAENVLVVTIGDRKVKVPADSDSASLYTLCRRWVRNDAPRKEQPMLQNFAKLLPKPLPAVKVEIEDATCQGDGQKDTTGASESSENFSEGTIESLSEHHLLQSHVKHFKDVRKRSRDNHMLRIERYKQRLALLLHPSSHQS